MPRYEYCTCTVQAARPLSCVLGWYSYSVRIKTHSEVWSSIGTEASQADRADLSYSEGLQSFVHLGKAEVLGCRYYNNGGNGRLCRTNIRI